MPVHYHIDRDLETVFVRAEGEVTFADLERYCRGVVADPDYRPGLNELTDFRGATGDLSTPELYKLRDINRELSDRVGDSRLAYVVDCDFGYGLGRMFMVFSEASKVSHQVFRSVDAARSWLGLPASDPP